MTTPTPDQMLARYLQAELDLLDGKTITFNGRTLSFENLAEIRKGRQEWERKAAAATTRAPNIGGLGYGVARFDGE